MEPFDRFLRDTDPVVALLAPSSRPDSCHAKAPSEHGDPDDARSTIRTDEGHRRRFTLALLSVVVLVMLMVVGVPTTEGALTTPACLAKKLKEWGKLRKCQAVENGKALQGKPFDLAKCQTKLDDKLGKLTALAATAGVTCRYRALEGGIADLDTALVWEEKLDGGGVHDWNYTATWSAGTAGPPSGTAFWEFLGTLNHGTSADGSTTSGCFAGHCDWRLPLVEELRGLLLAPWFCGTHPCIDPLFGPTKNDFYWSATTAASDASMARIVSFYDGGLQSSPSKLTPFYVRAVRPLLGGTVGVQPVAHGRCLAKKLKEWGKLRQCQAGEIGKVLQFKPSSLAKCQTKFDTKLAKLTAQATATGTACRYGVNGDGTATDYDTGLQWEQKTSTCPAGWAANGSYTTAFPTSGTFTAEVAEDGLTWTGEAHDSVLGTLPCSGTVTGTTLNGSCGPSVSVSITIDCTNYSATVAISGPTTTGSGSGTAMLTTDSSYTWSLTSGPPDGTAFTEFLGTLNDGTSSGWGPTTSCFAGHCDWRLPAIGELAAILDLGAPGCGSGGPCIDQTVFGPTLASYYWSGTTDFSFPDSVWIVDFFDGYLNDELKGVVGWVRAVRSGL